jgi:transcriptional regulator GlxA family with amidase domain
VGRALRMLHNDPARRWTVASLAAETGVSRAAPARLFTELVGEPPMRDLTGWRLALAADLLREPDATVAAVAYCHAARQGSWAPRSFSRNASGVKAAHRHRRHRAALPTAGLRHRSARQDH